MIQILALTVFLLWNILTFVFYGLDKRRAVKGTYRLPEKLLLSMTLLGGGLGAFLGGRIFRHKTRKVYFRLAWLFGLLLDIVIIYWIRRG